MKRRLNQYHFTIFTLLAILAILTLGLNQASYLGGAVVLDRELLPENQYQIGCVDNDPSNYYDVKGFVKHKDYLYRDYCSDGRLFQVYCASSKVVRMTRGYDCPNGCENGACLS